MVITCHINMTDATGAHDSGQVGSTLVLRSGELVAIVEAAVLPTNVRCCGRPRTMPTCLHPPHYLPRRGYSGPGRTADHAGSRADDGHSVARAVPDGHAPIPSASRRAPASDGTLQPAGPAGDKIAKSWGPLAGLRGFQPGPPYVPYIIIVRRGGPYKSP